MIIRTGFSWTIIISHTNIPISVAIAGFWFLEVVFSNSCPEPVGDPGAHLPVDGEVDDHRSHQIRQPSPGTALAPLLMPAPVTGSVERVVWDFPVTYGPDFVQG